MRSRHALLALFCSSLVVTMPRPPASAQPTADERARAADAYDLGVSAFRARDYATAARWFETANRLYPSSAAVVQAVRAYRNVRDVLRAGSLALRLEDEPNLSAQAAATVRQAISAARPRYLRVEVVCSAACTLLVDGAEQAFPRFFLEPTREVTVVARFAHGERSERVSGRAGTIRTLAFDAPEGPPEVVEVASTEEDLAIESGENPYRISRLRFLSRPRATFFMTVTAATAVVGITTWSGVDARRSERELDDAIESGETAERIAVLRSQHRQDVRRTRGYLGFTAVMVSVTGLVAAFTDWTPHGDDDEADTQADVQVGADSATLTLHHRF